MNSESIKIFFFKFNFDSGFGNLPRPTTKGISVGVKQRERNPSDVLLAASAFDLHQVTASALASKQHTQTEWNVFCGISFAYDRNKPKSEVGVCV